jgi:hypothetical protein
MNCFNAAADVDKPNADPPRVQYGIAHTPSEFEAIHRLNYRAFVEEIPQHPPNAVRRLVDRFHDENTYVIAKRGEAMIGMVCIRRKRPFSLDGKLPDIHRLLPPAASICELRLLYVVPEERRSAVFIGLARALFAHAIAADHDLAIVSATLREARLYRHLGFVPFGPEVGAIDARYQPMWLNLSRLTEAAPSVVEQQTC